MMNTNSPDDLLQFKDFSNVPGTSSPPQISVNSPNHSDFYVNDEMNNPALDTGAPNGNSDGSAKVSFLTIEYYRQFFNVDTFMVLDRIANSMIPKRAPVDYLRTTIEQNPDLYGPFWIGVTLIFSMAITGNIFAYIIWARDDIQFHYNFRLVSYAATAIFLYANLIPLALWAAFKYTLKPVQEGQETQNADYTPSLLALICVFGYSLSIYIPVSVLWVIPNLLLKLSLVIFAGGLSGIVLIIVLRPALRNSTQAAFLLLVILGLHLILAGTFLLLFFHLPDSQTLHPLKMQTTKAVPSELLKAVNNSLAKLATN